MTTRSAPAALLIALLSIHPALAQRTAPGAEIPVLRGSASPSPTPAGAPGPAVPGSPRAPRVPPASLQQLLGSTGWSTATVFARLSPAHPMDAPHATYYLNTLTRVILFLSNPDDSYIDMGAHGAGWDYSGTSSYVGIILDPRQPERPFLVDCAVSASPQTNLSIYFSGTTTVRHVQNGHLRYIVQPTSFTTEDQQKGWNATSYIWADMPWRLQDCTIYQQG